MTPPPTGQRFCTACGAPVVFGSEFCSRCGAPVAAGVEAPAPEAPAPEAPPPSPEPSPTAAADAPPTYGNVVFATLRRALTGPGFVAAAIAAGTGAIILAAIAVAMWTATPDDEKAFAPSALSSVKGVAATWLALNQIGDETEAPLVGLFVGLLVIALATRAGRRRRSFRSPREALTTGALAGVPYGLLGVVAAIGVRGSDAAEFEPSPGAALLACFAIGTLGGVLGAAWALPGRAEPGANRWLSLVATVLAAGRMLAVALALALVLSLSWNLAFAYVEDGSDFEGTLPVSVALNYCAENAVGTVALGLGALFHPFSLPLSMHRDFGEVADSVGESWRVFALSDLMPPLLHLVLAVVLIGGAYAAFFVLGHRVARASPAGSTLASILLRWAVAQATAAVALAVLVAIAYTNFSGEDGEFGPKTSSVFALALFLGGLVSLVGAVLGMPRHLVAGAAEQLKGLRTPPPR